MVPPSVSSLRSVDMSSWPAMVARTGPAPALTDMLQATRWLLSAWDQTLSGETTAATALDQVTGVVDPSQDSRFAALADEPSAALADARDRPPRGTDPLPGSRPVLPRITVQMLDGFQVWLDEMAPVSLPRGKAGSLLKLLLLHRRRRLSRQRLCSMLWPQADAAGARNNLNVTLHRLRRALGDGAAEIRCFEDGYQFVAGADLWIDAELFEQHAEAGRQAELLGESNGAARHYEAAVSLYQHDLADDGEDGALARHAQLLRDRFDQVLERLAALHEAAGDLHACLRAALRHLANDDCNENAHRQIMRCYARLGQPQLAERQYRNCVHHLRHSMGLAPSAQTTALYREIAARALA